MNDNLRQVLPLLARDSFSLREVLMLCHSCKGMHALLTLNHGPVLVDVALDVQQMCDMSFLRPCRFDCTDHSYTVTIETTRQLMASLLHLDLRFKINSLCLDFCHEGYQATLGSVTGIHGPPSLHEYFVLSAVEHLRHLKSLHLYNVNLSTEIVSSYIATFTGHELSLVQCGLQMGDAFFAALGLAHTLRVLCLSGNSFLPPVASVSALSTSLQVLNCNDCVSADVGVLCRSTVHLTLQALHWNDNYMPASQKAALYPWLQTCTSLHTLFVRNTGQLRTDTPALVAALERMPQLTSLDVASNDLHDEVLAFAGLMPRLSELYISARRCHHVAMGLAWGKCRRTGPRDKFVMYEELEDDDLEVDV
jgi:hypothetical protein